MGLNEEIERKRKEITVDSYPMSIGEIANIYRDGELDVHPEFQRFFRWDSEQKSKFIESILLGIPIPNVFVAQKKSGIWEVIDGQQRLSTILEFMNCLKDQNDSPISALVLQGTKFLPSLKDVVWTNPEVFTDDMKVRFKREKIDFTIIKENDDSDEAKYELFQRLNTGGTHLSPQELRNCILIMLNRDFYQMLEDLASYANYQICYPTTETQHSERQDLETVLRVLIFTQLSDSSLLKVDKSRNIDLFITEQMEEYADPDYRFNIAEFSIKFKKIFDTLANINGEDTFKRFKEGRFSGIVMMAGVEAIIPGLFDNLAYWESNHELLLERIKLMYSDPGFIAATYRGVRAMDRMVQLISFSRRWFNNED